MSELDKSTAPNLSSSLIRAYVSQSTYAKGRSYQASGSVLQLEVEEDRPGTWLVTAQVRGSHIYEVIVGCNTHPNGTLLPVASECSCPVKSRCKHVAAVLIELAQHRDYFEARKPDWRDGISALLPQDNTDRSAGTARVALLFEIKQQRQQAYYGTRVTTETFLSVRIGGLSLSTGKWVQNRFSWRDAIGSTQSADQIDPQHREILQALWSLQLAGNSSYYGYSSDNNLLRLDRFSNSRLWQLLEEAQSAGIPLLTTANGNPPLRLGTTCSIALDISERTSGDLQLAPQLTIDGNILPKGVHVRFIGEPPIGLYWSQGPRGNLKQHTIHIARFIDPPSTFLLKALHDKASLDIPTADKKEFSTKYFPQIVRHNLVNTSRVRVSRWTCLNRQSCICR